MTDLFAAGPPAASSAARSPASSPTLPPRNRLRFCPRPRWSPARRPRVSPGQILSEPPLWTFLLLTRRQLPFRSKHLLFTHCCFWAERVSGFCPSLNVVGAETDVRKKFRCFYDIYTFCVIKWEIRIELHKYKRNKCIYNVLKYVVRIQIELVIHFPFPPPPKQQNF